MLDRFTHTNSKGEVFDFISHGIIPNYNDLRDFEWTVMEDNGRITGFKRSTKKKKIPFVFALSHRSANEIKDKFFEHFEYDVLTEQPGFFQINDYRFYCYIIKSSKTDYLKSNRYLRMSLEAVSDKPYWRKETLYSIDFTQNVGTDNMTYPFTYPFKYGLSSASVTNDSFMSSDAIIRMYGPALNPSVLIDVNTYQVNIDLPQGEYLEINTEDKTIYKYSNGGAKTNLFDARNKAINTFEKIPTGKLSVSSNVKMKVDVVFIEKRSEPKWSSSTQTSNA